jgi:UDP-3-O-[3-hydroxymyristoyl] glucosamine N-acyltransferase
VELSLNDLAALVGGELVSGGSEFALTGVAALEEAGPTEISFLGNEKYRQQFLETKAGVVIVPMVVEPAMAPSGVALLRVENPSTEFTKVIGHFAEQKAAFTPGIEAGAHVSPAATVDPKTVRVGAGAVVEAGAVIGSGCEIGSGAVIGRNVKIGENCLIYPNVTIRECCELGDRVIIQPGAVIGSDGFGYDFVAGRHEKTPQVGIVVLENDVEIGANTTIDRARFGKTVIGEGTKVDNLVQIAHNVVIGKHCLLIALSGLAGSCKLGNYVTVAAQSGVGGHVELGDQIILAGGSGISKSLKTPGVYFGTPARPMRQEMRARASLARLPKLREELKRLQARVDALEE